MINTLLASNVATYVILGVLVVAIVVMFVFSNRRRKKQEQDAKDLIDAVKPGNKVKTIGGICGIVVEVDEDENTFVLETGTEQSGKCFIKFDKQAIYQTDAVVKPAESAPAETASEPENADEVFEEEKPEEATSVAEEKVEEKAEEKKEEPKAEPKTNGAAKTQGAAKTAGAAKTSGAASTKSGAKKPASKSQSNKE